jgi:pimeloyl-ACP methyl ester carboxylesterase
VSRWFKLFTVFFVALLLLGVGYQQWGEARDAKLHPAPGRLVSVGQNKLHIWCIGTGSPTVVMISGGGTPAVALYPAQIQIAKFTRVCSYDRAGLGWSEPATKLMDLAAVVAEMEELLTTMGVTGPIVLAPQSFGGLIALSYAAKNPDRVAGAVFIDASEPELYFRAIPPTVAEFERKDMLWQIAWRLGIIRAGIPYAAPDWIKDWPPEIKAQFFVVWSRSMAGYTSDFADVATLTPRSQIPVASVNSFGNKPVIVLRHGRTDEWSLAATEADWPAAQMKLAKLSSAGRLIVAKNNGHPIAEENPELVASSVKTVVRLIRTERYDKEYK